MFCENQVSRNKSTERITWARILLIVLLSTVAITGFPATTAGKSLYVIANMRATSDDHMLPVHAYDIGPDGRLTFQTQWDIHQSGLGAVGMAMDADSGYIFVTFKARHVIQVLDVETLTDAGSTIAPDASDLASIVYDHKKKRLYTVDRGKQVIYVYDWNPETATLTHMEGSPFTLRRAVAYGIALDEINGLLYVANFSNSVRVYSTSDWELVDTFTVGHVATSIAVDAKNSFVYTGGGNANNAYLTQFHLPTGIKREVQVNLDGGIVGLAVDPDTGLVYMSTSEGNETGGGDLLVYDTALRQIDSVLNIGNPAGLVVPVKQVGYNPLNLRKVILDGPNGGTAPDGSPYVGPGTTVIYGIHFDNNNSYTATDVSILDILPDSVAFVRADDVTGSGHYNSKAHTYEWSYPVLPPGSSVDLEVTVEVPRGIEIDKTIANTVTIKSNETSQTTTSTNIVTMNNPLNLTKSIFGGADDQVKGVDANEPVTYTICFDNNDNDFSVTNVTVVDVLPDEVSFVAAGEGKEYGAYDALSHTFTWSYPSIKPGSFVCLGLLVHVNPDVTPGTIITNSAIIDSDETAPVTSTVDAVTYLDPLNISKSIVGAVEGQRTWVSPDEKITYAILFHNKNDLTVNNVSIVDRLPAEVSFVRARADDPGVFGRYDPKDHTYTWSYTSLPPDRSTLLDLVVQVNKDAAPGTTITNSVTIDSDQTPPTTASAEAVTYYSSLDVSKIVVGSVVGETEYVDTNEFVVYGIRVDNNNDAAVSNVSIMDTLPRELSFITADGEGVFGRYDAKSHAYTWSYPTIAPKSSTYVELTARVRKSLSPSTPISNLVTADSNETAAVTATADVEVGQSPLQIQELRIVPEVIRRAGASYDVQAIAILPAGIGRDDIKDTLPTLYPGRVRAKQQIVYGTDSTAKVVALFDKAELVAAIPEDGEIQVKVAGKLKEGRSFFGETTIYITKFAGN